MFRCWIPSKDVTDMHHSLPFPAVLWIMYACENNWKKTFFLGVQRIPRSATSIQGGNF